MNFEAICHGQSGVLDYISLYTKYIIIPLENTYSFDQFIKFKNFLECHFSS